MGVVRSLGVLTAGAVMGATALIAYRIMQETGKPLQEAVAEVPAEIGKLYAELRVRAREMLEAGRAVYQDAEQDSSESLPESGAGQQ
jgi:hypothetical protein